MSNAPTEFSPITAFHPLKKAVETAEVTAGMVCKAGPKTGVTFGVVSADPFSLFNQKQHNGAPSIDWVVTNHDVCPFFAAGDSGSWAFDRHGRVVGIVTGQAKGRAVRRMTDDDTTPMDSSTETWQYLVPIRSILRDIERVTGCTVTLEMPEDEE
jgi:hypothetical protein